MIVKDIREVMKWMRKRFGRKAFTPNIEQIISEHVNRLSHLHEAEETIFKDKKGLDFKTVLSRVTDLNLFVDEVARARKYKNPVCIFGCDGGQAKCIVTLIVKDKDNETEEEDEKALSQYKPTGQKRVMVVAKADEVPETRENVEILLNSLNFPELSKECQVVCDLKLCNFLLGIQSCSSRFGCPYCEGYKVDPETNKPTNGKGVWLANDLRTGNKITKCQNNWEKETNKDRKKLKNPKYKSCEYLPVH